MPLNTVNPISTSSWTSLLNSVDRLNGKHISDLFREDPDRFKEYSFQHEDILIDFSKNKVDVQLISELIGLAGETGLKDAIQAMFNGEAINRTEGRSVLHTALRNQGVSPVMSEGKDVMPEIRDVLAKMKIFCNKIHSGEHVGYTGKPIRHIVNIGI